MTTSELITPQHRARKALIYVRQSTPQQALSHQESLRLQYALEQRAVSLGWRPEDVVVVDADVGLTATSAEHRAGFKEVVAQVTLGQVGILLSYDVTRLARNCSDWYPLLDVCGDRRCLIADRDGIYDPGSPNGRLLLGLKGQLSELELHTIRARLTAGLLNKAERGELALTLPVGLVRDALGRVVKDPHREVQDRLALVFTTFLEVRSATRVLHYFNKNDLLLPRRDRFGDVVWKKPTVAALHQRRKDGLLVTLPGGQHNHQRFAAPLGPHMHFGTETAPAAAQGLVLGCAVLGPGRMLMRAHHGAIHEVQAPVQPARALALLV